MSDANTLELRYRRLLRAYPASYRAERGEEILATYMDTAPPDRARPSIADVWDVLSSATRQWLRGPGSRGPLAGAQWAGALGLAAATGLAAYWLMFVELTPIPSNFKIQQGFGPFQTVGAVAWLAWLVTGATAAAWPKATRALTVVSLALTIAAAPAAAWYGNTPPKLTVLLPQLGLGVVALAFSAAPGRLARLLPAASGAATLLAGLMTAAWLYPTFYNYVEGNHSVLQPAGLVLLAVGLGFALLDFGYRRGSRGLWTLLLLLAPALLCTTRQLGTAATMDLRTGAVDYSGMWLPIVTTASAVTGVSIGILLVAVLMHVRADRARMKLDR